MRQERAGCHLLAAAPPSHLISAGTGLSTASSVRGGDRDTGISEVTVANQSTFGKNNIIKNLVWTQSTGYVYIRTAVPGQTVPGQTFPGGLSDPEQITLGWVQENRTEHDTMCP